MNIYSLKKILKWKKTKLKGAFCYIEYYKHIKCFTKIFNKNKYYISHLFIHPFIPPLTNIYWASTLSKYNANYIMTKSILCLPSWNFSHSIKGEMTSNIIPRDIRKYNALSIKHWLYKSLGMASLLKLS